MQPPKINRIVEIKIERSRQHFII